LTPQGAWDDVIDFACFRTEILLQLTLFAAIYSTFSDKLSKMLCYVRRWGHSQHPL
jgi:hypothetical protein